MRCCSLPWVLLLHDGFVLFCMFLFCFHLAWVFRELIAVRFPWPNWIMHFRLQADDFIRRQVIQLRPLLWNPRGPIRTAVIALHTGVSRRTSRINSEIHSQACTYIREDSMYAFIAVMKVLDNQPTRRKWWLWRDLNFLSGIFPYPQKREIANTSHSPILPAYGEITLGISICPLHAEVHQRGGFNQIVDYAI